MNTKHTHNAFVIKNAGSQQRAQRIFFATFALVAGLLYAHDQTHAATYVYANSGGAADISQQPISSTSSATVKPNIMFTLDDSGSMDSGYMPDNASDLNSLVSYRFWGCNTIYYKPTTTYAVPKKPDGTNLNNSASGGSYFDVSGNALFTNAPSDGFYSFDGNSVGATNLGTSYKADGGSRSETAGTAYYFVYNGTQQMYNNGTTYYNSGDPPPFCSSAPSFPLATTNTNTTSSSATKQSYAQAQAAGCSITGSKGAPASSTCSTATTSGTTTAGSSTFPTTTTTTVTITQTAGTTSTNSSNWQYTVTTTAVTTTDYRTYNSDGTVATITDPTGMWTQVYVYSGDTQATNFANWYSYYRERLMMAKAAAGIAFSGLGSAYRVGFITIYGNKSGGSSSSVLRCAPSNTLTTGSSGNQDCKYMPIDDFGAIDGAASGHPAAGTNHKTDWFNVLYSQSTYSTTPLPSALQRVGEIYAGKIAGRGANTETQSIPITDDPVQYSCQQNFTILTTDGYWNVAVDTAVHNADGDISKTPRPMYDGASAAGATQTTYSLYTFNTYKNSNTNYWQYVEQDVTSVKVGTTTTTTYSCGSASSTNGCTVVKSGVKTSNNNLSYTGTSTVAGNVNGGTSTLLANVICATFTGSGSTSNGSCKTPSNSTTITTAVGGSFNTLSDVASYYYTNDLRNGTTGSTACTSGSSGQDVCKDNVPNAGSTNAQDDNANYQHMTTFTMGFGVFGTIPFESNYKTDLNPCAPFQQLVNGSKPTTGCTNAVYGTGSYINWSIPVNSSSQPCNTDTNCNGNANAPEEADDLWHAAVDGHGQAFSATSPDDVVTGLNTALAGVNARVASASAAATSNLQPVDGDNFAYTASYTTVAWTGELQAKFIDLTTGAVGTTPIWSAQTKLDTTTGATCDNRTIYLYHPGGNANIAGSNLVNFTWNTQACDSNSNPTGSASTGLDSTELSWFGSTAITPLSQYPNMTDGTPLVLTLPTTVDQRTMAAGGNALIPTANLVNFVRGQRGYEGFASNSNYLYRQRAHILGDIVHSQPVYVSHAFASYGDDGYTDYATAQANRTPMVYVGANDGMLHAIYSGTVTTTNATSTSCTPSSTPTVNADGSTTNINQDCSTTTVSANAGTEAWAYIPRFVAQPLASGQGSQLATLADTNYSTLHRYYVDGSITVGDVYFPATDGGDDAWHTILVSGVDSGGKGFFALDITDPAHPKALWEFAYTKSIPCFDGTSATENQGGDCNLGYSYANPEISKMSNTDTEFPGRWVVFVTSGYNNVIGDGTAGDGQGFLYVLDAMTGAILKKIGTGVGNATTPSNLGKINNWVNEGLVDNTTQRVYGGDMLGNVWRFDVNGAARTGSTAILLANLTDASGNPQPITTKPELTTVGSSSVPYVYIATGSYLGNSDVSSTQQQSIYALADNTAVASNAAAPSPFATLTGVQLRANLKQVQLVNMNPPTPDGTNAQWRTTQVDCAGSNCSVANESNGWFIDLPDGSPTDPLTGYGSERVSTDMRLQLGTLVIGSNVPGSNACDIGGYAWLNYLDYATGEAVKNAPDGLAAQMLSNSVVVGINIIRLPDGTTVVIATTADSAQTSLPPPVSANGLTGRRVGWRVIESD